YREEAKSWRQWLLRAIAGSPAQMQTIYGVRGERRLLEYEVPWLSGYEDSRPVRVGNAASTQFQLDVYGEVLAAAWQGHLAGIKMTEPDWALMVSIMKFLESHWQEPDEGIWEVRGGRQQFTHSKMMAWLAFDRAIKMIENCECAAYEHFGRWKKNPRPDSWPSLRARLQREEESFHAGLWVRCFGCELADNAARWVSPGQRRAYQEHNRSN